jgi:hypothetical protein
MSEPLFWNPLPEAAKWLSDKTKRPFDARALIHLIALDQGNPALTIIKAPLPSNYRYAKIHKGDPLLSEKIKDDSLNNMLKSLYGELPSQFCYMSFNFMPGNDVLACPLPASELLHLMVHGRLGVSRLYGQNLSQYEQVWLMPYGSEYEVTIETCGINQADLIALGDRLVEEYAPKLIESDLRDDGHPLMWQDYAKQNAPKIWKDLKRNEQRSGKSPSKKLVGEQLVTEMKKLGYKPDKSKMITLDNLNKQVLTEWKVPSDEE